MSKQPWGEAQMPTPDQLTAVEVFRKKWSDPARLKRLGVKDWKDALRHAWATGADEREPHSSGLRQIRNDPRSGHAWLEAYQPPKE